MTYLSSKNRIAIAEICFYAPTLLLALFLAVRHGLGRNAAWFYLTMFSLIRLTGAALELETIKKPLSIPINTSSMILQSIGISPLMLMVLSILGWLVSVIRAHHRIILKPIHLSFFQMLVILGLVLGIVGGVKAGNHFADTWHFQMPIEGKVGLGLICAGFGFVVLLTVYVAFNALHIPNGERRLLVAVVLSLPFILVRVVYGCLATFTTDARFNQLTGTANYFLGMAVLMEIMAVVLCAGIGSTVSAISWEDQKVNLREMTLFKLLDQLEKRL